MNTYGQAGMGAVEQVVQSRISARPDLYPSLIDREPEYVSKDRSAWSIPLKIAAIPAVIVLSFLAGLVFAAIADAPLLGLILAGVITIFGLRLGFTFIDDFLSAKKAPYVPIIGYSGYSPDPQINLRLQVQRVFKSVLNGADVNIFFQGREIPWVLGAVGEIRTARILDSMDFPGEVIHDIEIRDKGRVTANIDHLICSDRGVVIVDTKVWSALPTISHGSIIPGSPNAESVSTINYEASFLPATPAAMIVAVGGKAKHVIPAGGIKVSRFPERFSDRQRFASYPIWFIAQENLTPFLESIYPSLNGRPSSAADILNQPGLSI